MSHHLQQLQPLQHPQHSLIKLVFSSGVHFVSRTFSWRYITRWTRVLWLWRRACRRGHKRGEQYLSSRSSYKDRGTRSWCSQSAEGSSMARRGIYLSKLGWSRCHSYEPSGDVLFMFCAQQTPTPQSFSFQGVVGPGVRVPQPLPWTKTLCLCSWWLSKSEEGLRR